MSPVEKSRMSPVEDSNNNGGKKSAKDFKTVFFKDSKDVEKVEKKEKSDKFKKLLVNLEKKVCELKNDEVKSEIIKYLKSLGKVNDEELKNSLFITEGIIDRVEKLIIQSGSDEETVKSILTEIEGIRSYCK